MIVLTIWIWISFIKIMILVSWNYLRFFFKISYLYSYDFFLIFYLKKRFTIWIMSFSIQMVFIFHDMISFYLWLICLIMIEIFYTIIFFPSYFLFTMTKGGEVMIIHGRMQFDKLIPSWCEIFMTWNDACNTYDFIMMMHLMYCMSCIRIMSKIAFT